MDVDMALSDLIKTTKSNKVARRSSKFKNTQKKGVARRQSGVNKAQNTLPRRRHSEGSSLNQVVVPGGDKRTVRLNISNLADSVVSLDLQELFRDFRLRKVSVNFDEKGSPLGTADIEITKANADRLIHQFSGVALDGKKMKFSVIETSNMASRVVFRGRRSFEPKRVANKSPRAPQADRRKVQKNKKVEKKTKVEKKKTTEELDAELDAYMAAAV